MFSNNRFEGHRMKRGCDVPDVLMAVAAAQAEKVQSKTGRVIVPSHGKRGRAGSTNAMHPLLNNSTNRSLNRALEVREAVLLTFCDPLPGEYTRLLHLSRKDWEDLLRWLDVSGLALYFFDRLEELGLLETLPMAVLTRLQQNLADNSKRINAMIAESVAIQRRFQETGLSYAVLKGFSLWPMSVPKLELRSQLDLDFLVEEEGAMAARCILEEFGYRMHAISGRSWEFKVGEHWPPSLNNLYKAGVSRTAELHLESPGRLGSSLLSRTQKRHFHGVLMPILSPVDLFLGQGLHLYKHVSSEFARTAHLIEFRRHVLARFDDDAFWVKLQQRVSNDPEASLRLGVVILLISRTMGRFSPHALSCWTVDHLPAKARLWVDLYGRRTALASFPGSKLYLLLENELESEGFVAKRSLPQALLPRRLPPVIAHSVEGENYYVRLHRYYWQLHFIFFRLHFHLVEGVRYLYELIFWLQYRKELSK
jgi:hypothetical protein